MRSFAFSLLAVAVAAIAPSAAHASTVGVDGAALTFAAAPGEPNEVTVTAGTSTLTVTDTGATVTPGAGCSSVAPTQVTCALAGVTSVSASTGDGDDTFDMKGIELAARLDGGTGADHLHAGRLNDTLIGGGGGNDNLNGDAGADVLIGGTGDDSLNGGSGTDTLIGDLGADVLKGGGDSDSVDYSARSDAITADPDDVADDGATGEGDNVATDIEMIVGGSGADRLSAAATVATTLVGGPGADVLAGGSGADTIVSRDYLADSVSCGASATDAVAADFLDAVASDCEAVVRANYAGPTGSSGSADSATGATGPAPGSSIDTGTGGGGGAALQPVQITGPSTMPLSRTGTLPVRVSCIAAEGSCRGTIEILDAASGALKRRSALESARRRRIVRRSLGRRKFKVRAGARKTVPVRLSRRGRRFVIRRKKRKTKAKLVVTTQAPDGTEITTVKPIWIKPPPERRTVGRDRAPRN